MALRKLSKQSYTIQPWIAGLATDGNELTPSVTADIKGMNGMRNILEFSDSRIQNIGSLI